MCRRRLHLIRSFVGPTRNDIDFSRPGRQNFWHLRLGSCEATPKQYSYRTLVIAWWVGNFLIWPGRKIVGQRGLQERFPKGNLEKPQLEVSTQFGT